jgi:DNA-binding transcriptional ArsR family regulator
MTVPPYQAKAEFFRTLGHPVRIRILELLGERDRTVHELLDAIAVEPGVLSHQLAMLRRASLVAPRRGNGQVVYTITVPAIRQLLVVGRQVLADVARVQQDLHPGFVRHHDATDPDQDSLVAGVVGNGGS